jgi:UDP-N-acetylmuramyl pentapeptide phosphotransferase/UDP-N-acetylglucosamine-1-phosphate transferase
MLLIWLLLIFLACAVTSLLCCGIGKLLFPNFRSGEHKPGTHRSDLIAGGREIKTIELPLVGGPAFTLAIVLAGILAGYLLHFQRDQWTLLLLGLGTTVGYMIVGFIDDWHKVYSKEGLSERAKLAGVFLVSIAAAALYFFLLPSGRESYSPYKDIPFLGSLLCYPHTTSLTCSVLSGVPYYGWLVFLMLMTGLTGSATSLSVDFSDGLDGLAGGLVFSAALAFAIIVINLINNGHSGGGIVLEVMSLLCAASVLGYLPWNWPSAWAARRSTAKRRAKIYMGDSGSLALGGLLAMIAIFSRQELLLFLVGGAFVLEGLSALVQGRTMTPFFRKRLQLLRFAGKQGFVPHTEFPLPFLATPLHHHFDLLGWDRRRLVYAAWALGACFALLGVSTTIEPFAWQRYLGRILILILGWIVWSSGSWSKRYFVGTYPVEKTRRRRRLALYYGYPYRLMGINLFHRVEVIEANEDVIETPVEEVSLWQRLNIFDARAMLGLYCYRAGYFPAALAQWMRIPEKNRAIRPEIARLAAEVENRIALEKQETQPMRRDQILQQQPEPIFTSNNPADMPNPHEPVQSSESGHGPDTSWSPLQTAIYPDESDDEEQHPTAPLRSNSSSIKGNTHALHDGIPPTGPASQNLLLTNQQGQPAIQPSARNWFARLLRHPAEE